MTPLCRGPEHNRLIHEDSPYLLQHARNPVDWYPWGPEAFARAKTEDKPVFLSIGYSSCHWCHVMERESFENPETARTLNEHFVCIKVDREERPDIDDLYMLATQVLTGSGGWPNSVWLTPDARPWFAGTYFPPEERFGRPGFRALLDGLSRLWRTRRAEVDEEAGRLAAAVARVAAGPAGEAVGLSRSLVARALDGLRDAFDAEWGGFGGAPKFPPHGALRLLLHEYGRTRDESLLCMLTLTLDRMAAGGIRDPLGGGFHRYSTDGRWFLPHFEKMLYDNAQLARVYVDAWRVTGNERYRAVTEETLDWVLREMTDGSGAFYSALDADSDGEEGKYYLWTRDEIVSVLGQDRAPLFLRVHGVEEAGNVREESTGRLTGANVLHLPRSIDVAAAAEGMTGRDLLARMAEDRSRLLAVRGRRPSPALDDKVLLSWNGLMVGCLAHAGRALGEARYVEAARRAAEFLFTRMREGGRLRRSWRRGRASLTAYLDDYAFLADALLDLHEATGEGRYWEEAISLMEVLLLHHRDAETGGFFFTADDHEPLLARSKDPLDRAVPSGNAVAAGVLVRLARGAGEERWRNLARSTIEAFSGALALSPRGVERFVLSLSEYLDALENPPGNRCALPSS